MTRWLDDSEQQAWRAYVRMQSRLNAALGRQMQADSQLSLPDFEVLVQLTDAPEGRVRVFELARALDWEKSRLSHHLRRMQKRGLVAREECPDDARGAFIALTPEGQAAIDQAAPHHVDTVRKLVFDVLTREQVDALHAISERILQVVRPEDCPQDRR